MAAIPNSKISVAETLDFSLSSEFGIADGMAADCFVSARLAAVKKTSVFFTNL
jgi:hypothetical protein